MATVQVFERNGFKVEWQKGVASGFDAYVLLGEARTINGVTEYGYRRQYVGNAAGKAKAIAACKRKGGNVNKESV